jgi:hypothetical protein
MQVVGPFPKILIWQVWYDSSQFAFFKVPQEILLFSRWQVWEPSWDTRVDWYQSVLVQKQKSVLGLDGQWLWALMHWKWKLMYHFHRLGATSFQGPTQQEAPRNPRGCPFHTRDISASWCLLPLLLLNSGFQTSSTLKSPSSLALDTWFFGLSFCHSVWLLFTFLFQSFKLPNEVMIMVIIQAHIWLG